VHVVVPYGIDDPRRPSGGNVYDRRATQPTAAGPACWSRPATRRLSGRC